MARQKRNLTEEEKARITEAKQELNDYRENIKYIEGKLQDTEETKAKLEKVTAVWSQIKTNSSSDSPDKFADIINDLDELKIDIAEKMQELLFKKFMIDEKIEYIDQPYRNVLFYRYARGKSWENVANELGYSIDHIYELHGEALYRYSTFSKIPQ